MRIAVFNISRREIGGVERYLGAVCPALRAAGHDVALVYESDTPPDRRPFYEGESWCLAQMGADAALSAARAWNPDVVFVNGFSEAGFVSPLMEQAPAVFFCQDYVGTCISGQKATKFPVVQPCSRQFGWPCLLRYFPQQCGGRHPATMWREYQRQTARLELLRRGASLVTASEAMRAEYLRHGFDPERVQRVPFGLPWPCGAARRLSAIPWRLLFAGRMDRLKGGDLLIEALPIAASRLNRRLRLVMAGDGPARVPWEQRAKRASASFNSIEIEFTGWLDADALRKVYLETDLIVMPSVWPEPFGLSGLDGASAGLPAAAFDVGGISDWLRDGVNGALAEGNPPSATGIAAAIVRCFENPAGYQRLCEGAARAAREFTLHGHIDRLLEILDAAAR